MPAWGGRLERDDHQGADRLCLDLRRRRKMSVHGARAMSLDHAAPQASGLARLVAEAEVAGGSAAGRRRLPSGFHEGAR